VLEFPVSARVRVKLGVRLETPRLRNAWVRKGCVRNVSKPLVVIHWVLFKM